MISEQKEKSGSIIGGVSGHFDRVFLLNVTKNIVKENINT